MKCKVTCRRLPLFRLLAPNFFTTLCCGIWLNARLAMMILKLPVRYAGDTSDILPHWLTPMIAGKFDFRFLAGRNLRHRLTAPINSSLLAQFARFDVTI